MYATTREFLIVFGLNDLSDLPRVEDMAAALGLEAAILVERAPGEEMLPLEEPEPETDMGEPPAERFGALTAPNRASDCRDTLGPN